MYKLVVVVVVMVWQKVGGINIILDMSLTVMIMNIVTIMIA